MVLCLMAFSRSRVLGWRDFFRRKKSGLLLIVWRRIRFPSMFFKVCWDVVGKEVMAVFEAFHLKDQWCKYLSATFITFVPKKKGAA